MDRHSAKLSSYQLQRNQFVHPELRHDIKEIQWNIAGYAQKLNTFGHTFFRSCFKFIGK